MIIELYGLPGSGKTTYTKTLAEKGGFEIIKIRSRLELLWRNIALFLRHPAKISRLFFYTIRHAGSPSLLRYKIINTFLQTNAKYHKAQSVERAIIDQGYFQNFLSIFEYSADKKQFQNYVNSIFFPDTLIVLDIPEDVREERLKKRGYGIREDFSAAYQARFDVALHRNHSLILRESKELPFEILAITDTGESVPEKFLSQSRRLYYITNSRIPTEKAHGFQIVRMCEEFAKTGFVVELIIPSRKNPITENIFDFYSLSRNFLVRTVHMPDIIRSHHLLKSGAFWLQSLLFVFKLRKIPLDKNSVIYTRNPEIAWFFKKRGFLVIYEAHNWPGSKIKPFVSLIQKADSIICNSKGTEKKFNEYGLTKTFVAQNGVDIANFSLKEDIVNLKKELGIPLQKKIVMYVGQFYNWKGVDTVMEAWKKHFAERKDVALVFVGGETREQDRGAKNIFFYGYKPRAAIPRYLHCADILLLPNAPVTNESRFYTSPIKMFEYMAAKKPIIASDLPSIREVLSERNALFFEAGNIESLAEKIKTLLDDVTQNSELANRLSAQAFEDVKNYTWESRAQKITHRINTIE